MAIKVQGNDGNIEQSHQITILILKLNLTAKDYLFE